MYWATTFLSGALAAGALAAATSGDWITAVLFAICAVIIYYAIPEKR